MCNKIINIFGIGLISQVFWPTMSFVAVPNTGLFSGGVVIGFQDFNYFFTTKYIKRLLINAKLMR